MSNANQYKGANGKNNGKNNGKKTTFDVKMHMTYVVSAHQRSTA
jgi:hypothetical protein